MSTATRSVCRPPGRGLAAALVAGLAIIAVYGCSKQPPAEERGKVDKAAEEAAKVVAESQHKLKQIGLALHAFHDKYKSFPPAAICDRKTGKQLLSWRVALLPFIEQQPLYAQFKLDEPWDGPNNKKWAEVVVPLYARPGAKESEAFLTFYRGFVTAPSGTVTAWWTERGTNAPFGARGAKLAAHFRDGASETISVVEAPEAVPWTKPDELVFDAKKPLPKLGGVCKDGFNALMVDGTVLFFSNRIRDDMLVPFITAAGGDVAATDHLKSEGLIK